MSDLYKVLGVQPDSEDIVIRGAFTALMKKYHPDVYLGDKKYAEERTKEINAAYGVLGDPQRRRDYDAKIRESMRKPEAKSEPPKSSQSRQSANPNQGTTDKPKPPPTSDTTPRSTDYTPPFPITAKKYFWPATIAVLTLASFLGTQGNKSSISPPPDLVTLSQPPELTAKAVATVAEPSTPVTTTISIPGAADWNTNDNPNPSKYIAGDYSIVVSATKDAQGLAVPQLDVDYPNYPHLHVASEVGSNNASTNVRILNLSPGSKIPALILMTYSGGAHCCTTMVIFQPSHGKWVSDKTVFDGLIIDLPKDLDGDGIPDIVLRDDVFNYAFDDYADSHPPPKILNFINGKLIDVSKSSRFSSLTRDAMLSDQADCLLHTNGACAAFVAMASRLGLHDWAFQFASEHYDQNRAWVLPTQCDIDTKGLPCPGDHELKLTFLQALESFLAKNGYRQDTAPDTQTPQPSFDCPQNPEAVIGTICGDSSLAAKDRLLAATFRAARSFFSSTPTLNQESSLISDQDTWTKIRDMSSPDPVNLSNLYDQRIRYLNAIIQQQSMARRNMGR